MITVFLPCRKGSERVKNKNTRPFAGIDGGLTYIKLQQLLNVAGVDKIILSTDDEEVKAIGKAFENSKIVIDNRPKDLASSSTSTDEVVNYVPKIIQEGSVLWTHVTSPFIGAADYQRMIDTYYEKLEVGFDSLMTVTTWYKFLWDKNGPINYDRNIEKWPRTQTLPPLYEVNSGAFLADISSYKYLGDRVGNKPFLYEQEERKSFDIDWEDDYILAEYIWNG